VLPGVNVTITEVNTNISYSTTTNESGYYIFSNLKDGTYRVTSELSGFKRIVRNGVDVPVNATVRVDLKMEVGNIEESVTVVASSPLELRMLRSDQFLPVVVGYTPSAREAELAVDAELERYSPEPDEASGDPSPPA